MKDAYYFPHDSNARNDQRLLKVRYRHGTGGYGAFFMLLEIMRDTGDYRLKMTDLEMIDEMEIHIGVDVLIDIVENYDLFEMEDGYFYSISFDKRMQKMNDLREIRAKAGRKGGKVKPKPKQTVSKSKALKENILKKNILNNKKDIKSLESINKEFLNELQEKHLDIDVFFQFDKFKNYLSANGKSYKDYRAGFRNWLVSGFCEKTDKIRLKKQKIQTLNNKIKRDKELENNSATQEEMRAEMDKAIGKISRKYTV
ncbi:hypothetical protein CMO96_00435 [Candidatus Woesebacteria bacterium]|nr:hypothetical protein [Candidatus Woesebacteria bacterium]